MAHLVYPVGPGRGDLLRYALRSLEAHAAGTYYSITVVGHLPDYIDPDAVTHINVPKVGADPFRHVWALWQATAARRDAWWWMNDDFFLTGPVEDALVHRHRGTLAAYVESLKGRPGTAPWRQRAAALDAALDDLPAPGDSRWCWETHRPMYASARAVLAAAEWCERIGADPSKMALRSMFNVFEGYSWREIAAEPDPKLDTIQAVPLPTPVVSVSPRAWRGRPGEAIRSMFPEPSPWEW